MSVGSTAALKDACLILINLDDEVLVFELYCGDHLSPLQSLEIVPRLVTLQGQEREVHPS